jgi:hypothetical protein
MDLEVKKNLKKRKWAIQALWHYELCFAIARQT